MIHKEVDLSRDIERVKQIPIIATLLDVVCQTTGMGFAAVARVTEERWIACIVRDEIQFGLVPGGELQVESTVCNEIRAHHQAVIIDHVQESDVYTNHHTPLQYGFQSYISFPIILKNGEFFGTLCAIDPNPAQLNNSKITGMFSLFADLISFHLQQVELLEQSHDTVQNLSQQLTNSQDENRQYQPISNHNLQEPLRKLRIFSEMLIDATEKTDIDQARNLALKINSNAQKVSMMIKALSGFSVLDDEEAFFEQVNLNKIIADVCTRLSPQLKAKNVTLQVDELPLVNGIPLQLEQLFYHLVNNAVTFSNKNATPVVTISCSTLPHSPLNDALRAGKQSGFVEIQIKDNGVGIEKSQLEKIFDIFSQGPYNKALAGGGVGLAYCRKIIRNHSGLIKAQSEFGKGATFTVILPAI
ncbi:HAMP domain-containing sensor histidine kinase [Larkinella knui]|uniref:histidine kinase n=1 Tax=Larkinella knui TaxID=2025310 RepID=A0A3P1CE17_9BACT|nr:GAF domain-containing sensor histidine kinase [Larkinella knui]RRB11571.1 GAF domain-containing sensor histidine kinase [Larkinella knui]